tara:strand:+ start:631 stop:1746 length:1116 start_codon:yes stop_codon:yes gene_type:complete
MINVFEPNIGFTDILNVLQNLAKKNISGSSPVIQDFENKLSDLFSRNYAVSVTNGSVALDLSFQLLNLNDGDEVIVPSHTIISCLSAIVRSKAVPIFCDIDKKSWNMTAEHVEKLISDKTKAVLLVHTFGLPSEAKKIKQLCKDYNLKLIEDSAEAHGQYESGIKCGNFGDISTFSFYANKHITTGEGGALLTDSEEIYLKALQMRNLDFNSTERFKTENLYWNYRLSGLQASLGLSQIKKMKKTIDLKIKQGNYYTELLKDYDELFQLPLKENNGSLNHYWVYGVVLKKENIRDNLMEDLFKAGIETRPFFWPLHLQPSLPKIFSKLNNELPNSEYIGKNGLYIPLGSHVSKKMQKKIVQQLITKAESIV